MIELILYKDYGSGLSLELWKCTYDDMTQFI